MDRREKADSRTGRPLRLTLARIANLRGTMLTGALLASTLTPGLAPAQQPFGPDAEQTLAFASTSTQYARLSRYSESTRPRETELVGFERPSGPTVQFARQPTPPVTIPENILRVDPDQIEQPKVAEPSPSDYFEYVDLDAMVPPKPSANPQPWQHSREGQPLENPHPVATAPAIAPAPPIPTPNPLPLSIQSRDRELMKNASWFNQEDVQGNLAPDQTLGEQPPESPNTLQFLRQQTPLNAAGQWQFDIGFAYSIFDFETPVAILNNADEVIGVAQAQSRQRLLTMPMELRYGVTDGLQAFVGMPIGYSDSEISLLGNESHEEVAGIGDVYAGFNHMLYQGGEGQPDIIGTLSFAAPTGDPGNPLLQGLNPAARLGEGFWSLSVGALVIHQYDPIVVFWGGGYRHRFENDINGFTFQPGEEFNYQLGVGFAVNPEVTLSTSFLGAYMGKWEVEGEEIGGSVIEPQRLRFAATILKCNKIVEPFAEVGMTTDAPSGRVGVTWTY
ncbi:MAG: transporter [Pirellulaceae bacterium]